MKRESGFGLAWSFPGQLRLESRQAGSGMGFGLCSQEVGGEKTGFRGFGGFGFGFGCLAGSRVAVVGWVGGELATGLNFGFGLGCWLSDFGLG